MPSLGLFHFSANKQREQRRQSADKEEWTPSPVWINEAVCPRGQQKSQRIAFLQKSGNQASPFGRNRFHGERCADTPLSTHADAIKEAQGEKNSVAGSEARQHFNQ